MDFREVASQLLTLSVVATVSAWLAWLWVKEAIFSEVQAYCKRQSFQCGRSVLKKFWYIFTCETCFVHYPILALVVFRGYRLVERGVLGQWYAWIFASALANVLMTCYSLLRVKRRLRETREKVLGRSIEADNESL